MSFCRLHGLWQGTATGRNAFALLGAVILIVAPVAFAQSELSVTLQWDPVSDPSVGGYKVFYGTVSHQYTNSVDAGNSTSATIPLLTQGATYYFAVAAYDSGGIMGAQSAEISYTIPSNPNTPTISTIPRQILLPNTPTPAIPFTYSDTATDPSNLTLSVSSDNPALVPVANIVVAANGGNGTVTVTPLPSQTGVASITLTVSYGTLEASSTFQVEVASAKAPAFTPGTYSGLFYETNQVTPTTAGMFTFAVTARGTYSGHVQLGAQHLPFTGKFDVVGHATNAVARLAREALNLSLDLGAGAQANQVSGTVSDGSWTAALLGDRAAFNSGSNPAHAGLYTLILPGQSAPLPQGNGFGSVSVSKAGVVTFSGKLADGTPVTQSAWLSSDGTWPFYIPLYSGEGLMTGWLDFTNEVNDDLTGLVTWTRPTSAQAHYFPTGFTNQFQAAGSAYVPPATKGQRVLNLTNAAVAFTGGNLSTSFTNAVSIGAMGSVTNRDATPFTMTLWPGRGLITGQTRDPDSGALVFFSGAVFQKLNTGYGMHLGTNQSSEVFIQQ